jgi:hypothetical protein
MPSRRSGPQSTAKLSQITRRLLTTAEAAEALGYAPGTLRHWAVSGKGLIRPHRMGQSLTHLRWFTNDVRQVVGMPPLPDGPDEEETAARAEAHAAFARERKLRAEVDALRETLARIDATLGGQSELPL